MNKEPHEHSFKKIELLRITVIDNPKYSGSMGDKALLVRTCECGADKAFEMGEYKAMLELQQQLRDNVQQDSQKPRGGGGRG